jgi:hypothetical protein
MWGTRIGGLNVEGPAYVPGLFALLVLLYML